MDMKTDTAIGTAVLPPHAQLIQMATGYWVSRMVYAAARIGLADHLADGPKSAAELAGPTGTHESALHRLMRALASLGILSEDANHRFVLAPLGEALKSGAAGSARATVLALAGDWWWRGWSQFLYCLETGKTGMEKEFGTTVFEYLAQHPQEASYFNEAMIGFHGDEPAAVASAYDFSDAETIVDVGGGTGNLLAAILERHPRTRGILADLPHVTRDAGSLIESRGLAERLTIEAINFFERVPAGGDAYLLSHVIHDWNEDECLAILRNCRKAMKPGSRLLIVEMVLPPGDTSHPGKLIDLVMLVMPGGQERTEEQYCALLRKAGLRLTHVMPTASAVSVVEAVLMDAAVPLAIAQPQLQPA
jgi:SAM-dependent methyltransferase